MDMYQWMSHYLVETNLLVHLVIGVNSLQRATQVCKGNKRPKVYQKLHTARSMGASCGKGYAASVQPEPGDGSAEVFEKLHVDDSAADCIPAGYRPKRRQAVRLNHLAGSESLADTFLLTALICYVGQC